MQVREISSADVAIFAEAGDGERVVGRLRALPEPPPEVGARAIHLRRIEAGTPWFGLDGDESRLVPEIVPEDRVSFSKGCFLGQETIARVHWRGRVRRRIARLLLDASSSPRRGLPLRDPQGVPAGSLLSSARRFDGRVIALALREAEAASDEVIAEDGIRGRWLPDPGDPAAPAGGRASP
jgi:folate-binding protein YgfZ